MTRNDAGDRKQLPALRSVLIAGFGGMLLLFGIAAIQSIRLLTAMRAENQVLREQALDRSRKLATVRYCVLLSQQYLNDQASGSDLRSQWTHLMADLSAYPLSNDAQLRQMLLEHWSGLSRAMEQNQGDREIRPLRVSAVEITERVEDIDAKQMAATALMIQDQFDRLGHGLGLTLNLALGSALLLALGCVVYIVRIERQNQLRYQEIVALSARLVDAQETERRTISRELHDQVGQTLNALLVDAANLARRLPADDETSQTYLNNIRSFADSSVNSIRDIALLLRPSMLDDLGLIPALEWQARETSRRTGIDVRVAAENVDDSLPDAIRTCVYRVVQEALQNVSRHSGAAHVKINVRQPNGTVSLTIEDDGAGFDPRHTRGMGLLGMEERVRQLGGKLEVQSQPGKGTTLRVTLPVEDMRR
jgi:signal transduction histidine kinase